MAAGTVVSQNSPEIKYQALTTTTTGAQTVVTAVTGQRIVVTAFSIVNTSAQSLTWQSDSTALSGAAAIAALGIWSLAGSTDAPLMATAAGEALKINLSGSTQVSGFVAYFLV